MIGQFHHSVSDRTGTMGRYTAEESITLDPGQEIEVYLVAPDVPAIALFLDGGRLSAFGDTDRAIIPQIRWGARHREAGIILPGELVYIALKNISE